MKYSFVGIQSNCRMGLLAILMAGILVSIMAPVYGEQLKSASKPTPDIRNYELQVEAYSRIYPVRVFSGQLSKHPDGDARLTFHWKEPADEFFDYSDQFACCDILKKGKRVYLALGIQPPDKGRLTIDLSAPSKTPNLRDATDIDLIVYLIAYAANQGGLSKLDVPVLDRLNYTDQLLDSNVKENNIEADRIVIQSYGVDDEEIDIPSFPPFGRNINWRIGKNGERILTVRRKEDGDMVLRLSLRPTVLSRQASLGLFDPNTIGNPPHVPIAFKKYWRLSRAYWYRQNSAADPKQTAAEIYLDATELLAQGVPDKLLLPLNLLCAKAAAASNKVTEAWSCLDKYCYDARDMSIESKIVLLAEVIKLIASEHPNDNDVYKTLSTQAKSRIKKILNDENANHDACVRAVERLLTEQDYLLGRILLPEMHVRNLIPSNELEKYLLQIKGREIPSNIDIDNTCDYVSTFRKQLLNGPSHGDVHLDQLSNCLIDAMQSAGLSDTQARELAKETTNLISIQVGSGPYNVDLKKLKGVITAAIREKNTQKSDKLLSDWLAGFVALSFYDQSTTEHHEKFISQIEKIMCQSLDVLWDELKAPYLYGEIVTRDEIEEQSKIVIAQTTSYTENPLWPMFKYPLSENEIERVTSRMILQAKQEAHFLKSIRGDQNETEANSLLRERVEWLSRLIWGRIVSVRLPELAGIGFEASKRQPLQITWDIDIPSDLDKARDTHQKLLYFYLGHRL